MHGNLTTNSGRIFSQLRQRSALYRVFSRIMAVYVTPFISKVMDDWQATEKFYAFEDAIAKYSTYFKCTGPLTYGQNDVFNRSVHDKKSFR